MPLWLLAEAMGCYLSVGYRRLGRGVAALTVGFPGEFQGCQCWNNVRRVGGEQAIWVVVTAYACIVTSRLS